MSLFTINNADQQQSMKKAFLIAERHKVLFRSPSSRLFRVRLPSNYVFGYFDYNLEDNRG